MSNETNDLKERRNIKETFSNIVNGAENTASNVADKTKGIVIKSKDSVINAVDANGNGEIDIEDFIILGLRTPGIRVNRSDFLKKELMKNYQLEVITSKCRI